MTVQILSATSLIEDEVKNVDGQHIGSIEDLMVDLNSGRIVYGVLSFGGFLGLGDKYFAIPWQALMIDTVDERFILDVSKEALEHAEGFDKDDWPDWSDLEWQRRNFAHYGYEPYWEIA